MRALGIESDSGPCCIHAEFEKIHEKIAKKS